MPKANTDIVKRLIECELVTRKEAERAVASHERVLAALQALGGAPAKRRGRPARATRTRK